MHLRKELASIFSLASPQVEFCSPPASKASPVPAETSLTPSGSSHGAHNPVRTILMTLTWTFLLINIFVVMGSLKMDTLFQMQFNGR